MKHSRLIDFVQHLHHFRSDTAYYIKIPTTIYRNKIANASSLFLEINNKNNHQIQNNKQNNKPQKTQK
jgi:hypothetical protein